jgi:hypothetical protein
MSNNIQIGSTNTSPPATPFTAVIHGKTIYDSINWTQNGTLCWDATNKVFIVTPYSTLVNMLLTAMRNNNVIQ